MPDFNGRGGESSGNRGACQAPAPLSWECHAEPVPGSPGHKGREGGRAMGRLNQVRTKPWPQSRASSPSSSSRNYLFSKTQQKVALAQSQAKSFQVRDGQASSQTQDPNLELQCFLDTWPRPSGIQTPPEESTMFTQLMGAA